MRAQAAVRSPVPATRQRGRWMIRPLRSGARAAIWSFLFPGLGHAYLGERRLALTLAVPGAVTLLMVVLLLRDGLARAALRLLDPTVALSALVLIVALGVWHVAAVLLAARGGHRTPASRYLVLTLVVLLALTHGYAGASAVAFMNAGSRIFDGDPLAVSASIDGHDVPHPDDGPEGLQGSIEAGPTPRVDIATVDGLDDGLLNVAVVGIDWKPGRDHTLTDTMIVVSVNGDTGAVLMFSFPRDISGFPLYDGGTYTGRLNGFANYAQRHPERYPEGGMRALTLQFGYLLGVPVDYYAAVNIPGFADVVRAVGGVTIHNETLIDDPHLEFRLAPGEHRLNARDALMWVRSRKGPQNNDFARARRQQQMLAALRRELMKPARLADLPQVVAALSEVLTTDFPPAEVDSLLALADAVEAEPSGSWVFGYPTWAHHPPARETRGRSVMFLRIDKVAELSRELFGARSLYRSR